MNNRGIHVSCSYPQRLPGGDLGILRAIKTFKYQVALRFIVFIVSLPGMVNINGGQPTRISNATVENVQLVFRQ